MKTIILITAIVASLNSLAQTEFIGKIVSSNDNQPVAYVNIGIINKDVGTVSDIYGNFILKISDKYLNDSIRISSIGFISKVFKVNEILKCNRDTIYLDKAVYTLSEAVIKPEKYTSKIIGNRFQYGIAGSYGVDQLGNELGIKVELKGKPSMLEGFGFYLAENYCDTLFFRVNIYKITDTVPQENILKKNIFIKTATKRGEVFFDLKKYNLMLEDDFLISIEWIKNYEKDCIYFRYRPGIFTTPVFLKVASQGAWHMERNWGAYFFVSVKQLKQ
ncbi:MAG: carboxypeptidase-like regulatory domain-containing protein [Bacteroidota bacterium]